MCTGIFFPFPDPSFISFMGDDFLRLLLCRHIFACVVLRLHRSFRCDRFPHSLKFRNVEFDFKYISRPRRPRAYPSSRPSLPSPDVLDHPTLQRYAIDLAVQVNLNSRYKTLDTPKMKRTENLNFFIFFPA